MCEGNPCLCALLEARESGKFIKASLLGCSGIHSIEDKTVNGRRDLSLRVTTSLLCDLGQVTSSL